MLMMASGIVEGGFGEWVSTMCELLCNLLVFQQGKDDRNHLSHNTTKDSIATNEVAKALIVAALDRDEFLIEPSPFALLHLNRLPSYQVHRTLHQAGATWRESCSIKTPTGLRDDRCPAEVRLELAGAGEVGDVAN